MDARLVRRKKTGGEKKLHCNAQLRSSFSQNLQNSSAPLFASSEPAAAHAVNLVVLSGFLVSVLSRVAMIKMHSAVAFLASLSLLLVVGLCYHSSSLLFSSSPFRLVPLRCKLPHPHHRAQHTPNSRSTWSEWRKRDSNSRGSPGTLRRAGTRFPLSKNSTRLALFFFPL